MHLPGYFEFFCPVQIIAGHRALENMPALLERLHVKRPMVVADQGVVAAGLLDILGTALDQGVSIGAVVDDVPSDPDLKIVSRIAAGYRESGCDGLIAVGGGSVMDAAKGANLMVSEKTDALPAFAGAGNVKRPLRPLIAVPTTAGTGSEVTQVAMIIDRDRSLKLPFASHHLRPAAAVLDGRMTLTLPPAVTAATAMDALTHAIEAFTCLAKNPISDAFALLAIDLIGKNLLPVLKEPDNRDGRLALAVGANLAGVAFSNSMVGMVHALGHATGAVCGVPHGNCMAILLPYGLEYNMHKNGHLTAQLLMPLAGARTLAQTPAHLRAQQVITTIRQMNQFLHQFTHGRHPRFFKEIIGPDGISQVPIEKLEGIADKAMRDGSLLYNPEELDHDDLVMVMSHAWAGTPLDQRLVKKGHLQIR
jgi:alcohol dehydrogenase